MDMFMRCFCGYPDGVTFGVVLERVGVHIDLFLNVSIPSCCFLGSVSSWVRSRVQTGLESILLGLRFCAMCMEGSVAMKGSSCDGLSGLEYHEVVPWRMLVIMFRMIFDRRFDSWLEH